MEQMWRRKWKEETMTPNDSVRNVQLTNQGCLRGNRVSAGSRSALVQPPMRQSLSGFVVGLLLTY